MNTKPNKKMKMINKLINKITEFEKRKSFISVLLKKTGAFTIGLVILGLTTIIFKLGFSFFMNKFFKYMINRCDNYKC